MSFSLTMGSYSFLAISPQNIDDKAIQELLKPLEKIEADIMAKVDSIQKETSQPSYYSLGTRVMAFMAIKFAWFYGTGKHIIFPAADAVFEFTAKKLSVNTTSSLFFRAIPWIVYIIACQYLGAISDNGFKYLIGSALKSDEVFKAIRIVDELEKADWAYNTICETLNKKIEQLSESTDPSIMQKLQQQFERINQMMLDEKARRENLVNINNLSKGEVNHFYFSAHQLILG